jgi:murein DD-endopeptidase MepM/ murein hydrolase activator NlpD
MLRRTIAAIALLGLVALGGWLVHQRSSEAPKIDEVAAGAAAPAASTEAPPVAEPAAAAEPPPLPTQTIEIGKRDTLVSVLLRHEVPSAVAHQIASALREAGAQLRRLRAGETLQLAHDGEGKPARLTYSPSAWQRFEAKAGESGWTAERIDTEPEIRIEVREGLVENSLWDAVDRDGVSPQLVLDLVGLFESEFDFTADTQPGDHFRLLVQARYADGRYVEDGRIVAAQYRSADGPTMTGIGFQLADRFAFFDREGRSLRRMFLRSPLQFTRISSGFTYRRPHPILGGVRPHLAIDYAAPRGTPVWAVADGAVEFAGRKGGNGIQVLLRHRAGYKTYYNHLSRVAKGVKRGARVTQKQVIGYVGSTGLSTGPHLDYRVAKNGTFVNPLSERFLPGEPVPAAKREAFRAQASEMLARLGAEAPFDVAATRPDAQRSATTTQSASSTVKLTE